MIVAIDGPAGSGKSSTARAVARRLGFLYLDTGAMYRAMALAFVRQKAPATAEAAARMVPLIEVDEQVGEEGLRVFLNGEDVTQAIRDPEIGRWASKVSTLRAVREKLVAEQRRIGRHHAAHGGVVVDGRDIGTVVFPEAEVKVFMVADLDVRARRRHRELEERGDPVSIEAVRAEIAERDRRDQERALAPLRAAEDAILLDTSKLTFEQQVQHVVDRIQERD